MLGRIVEYDCGEVEQELGGAEPEIAKVFEREAPRDFGKRASAIHVPVVE